MDHSSVISGVMSPCVTCDRNSMLHNGGTFDGSDITRISVRDFPLSSANTTRFFDLKQYSISTHLHMNNTFDDWLFLQVSESNFDSRIFHTKCTHFWSFDGECSFSVSLLCKCSCFTKHGRFGTVGILLANWWNFCRLWMGVRLCVRHKDLDGSKYLQ